LQEAIDSAMKNNLSLQVSKTQVAYAQALKTTARDIEKTKLGFEYGSYNSIQKDNKIWLSQEIQFPGVYKHAGGVNTANIKLSESGLKQNEVEIRNRVKSLFYQGLVLQNKKILLMEADSMYMKFLDKTKQRCRPVMLIYWSSKLRKISDSKSPIN
jgi:cobalt-zinc-cadmium resistance protein CzcA